MKICLSMSAFLLVSFLAGAQNPTNTPDTGRAWKTTGSLQLNFSQVSLTNWQGGGRNLIAGIGVFDVLAQYKRKQGLWENKLHAGYGLLRQGDGSSIVQKSDDDLHFSSSYSHRLKGDWNWVGSADFRTTFTPGYKYKDSAERVYRGQKLSDFMSPGYLLLMAGAEYRPSKNFYLLMAPFSGKLTFVQSDSMSRVGAYGVKPGEKLRGEFGAAVKTMLIWKVMQNVEFQTDLQLFDNYKNFFKPSKIDVDWLAGLTLTVNPYLNVKVNTHLIYDDDIVLAKDNGTKGTGIQFKEVLALSLQWKF